MDEGFSSIDNALEMIHMLNKILRSFGFFDLKGLKYSIQHLEAIRPHIGTMDVHSQSAYVDAVTKRTVDSKTPLDLITSAQELQGMTPADVHRLNTTAIGNLAYLALHVHVSSIRTAAENLLIDYRKWLWEKGEQNPLVVSMADVEAACEELKKS